MNAILGNVGTMIIFRLGGQDADRIAKEFQPELHPHDFLNLGLGEFYIKMSVDGKTLQPFSAITLRLKPPAQSDNIKVILEQNQKLYRQLEKFYLKKITTNIVSPSVNELPPPL